MDRQRIRQAESLALRLQGRLGPLMAEQERNELDDIVAILSEVRHFAFAWHDREAMEHADKRAHGGAREYRSLVLTRLTQSIVGGVA